MSNRMNDKEYSTDLRSKPLEQVFPQDGIYAIVNRIHSLNFLHVISAASLILLGTAVVTVSVLGLIKTMWVSKLMIMAASIATMVGSYLLYSIFRESKGETLVRKAIRRVIEAQN